MQKQVPGNSPAKQQILTKIKVLNRILSSMTLSESDIIILEEYWQGKLSREEADSLEQRLKEDALFREEAEAWKTLIEKGFSPDPQELERRKALSVRLNEYEKTYSSPSKPSKTKFLWLYLGLSLAAGLAILLILNFWPSPSASDLLTHLERDSKTYASAEEAANQAYDDRDYKKALPLLLQSIEKPQDSIRLLYAGVAALHLDQAQQAISLLSYVQESSEWEAYHPEAEWYLALALIQNKDSSISKTFTQKIIRQGPEHPFYEEAQQLKIYLEE